jgi:ribonuclease HI
VVADEAVLRIDDGLVEHLAHVTVRPPDDQLDVACIARRGANGLEVLVEVSVRGGSSRGVHGASVAQSAPRRDAYAPTMGTAHDGLRAEFLRVELAIAERRVADLPGASYASVLHEAFHETGASGRVWTRDEVLADLAAAEPTDVTIEGFEIELLADGVVLATYTTGGSRPARRASVWMLDAGRWRLRFHQGTLL